MKSFRAIGWGIVIYSVMYLAWNLMVINNFYAGIAPRIALIAILFIVALTTGRSLRLRTWSDILPYSFVWAVVAAVLDAASAAPTSNWMLFLDWRTWLGYALIVVIPLFAPITLRFVSSVE